MDFLSFKLEKQNKKEWGPQFLEYLRMQIYIGPLSHVTSWSVFPHSHMTLVSPFVPQHYRDCLK